MCAAVKADLNFLFADGNICRHIDEVAENLACLRIGVAVHALSDQAIKTAGQHQQGHIEIHLHPHR